MHDHGVELDPPTGRKVARILSAIVIPLALATLIGLIWLWPTDSPAGTVDAMGEQVRIELGTVTSIEGGDAMTSPEVRMHLDKEDLEVPLHVPPEIALSGMGVGDRVKAIFNPVGLDNGAPYIFWDYERTVPLALLAACYLLVVGLVARWKGLAAVAGLGLSLAVVMFFMLPALLAGSSPLGVILTGAGAMMFASIYLAHGISVRTTTAVLGTAAGLLVTIVLAHLVTDRASLSGAWSADAGMLVSYGLRLDHILMCGMVLAGLGALNDVTITQVSTVWELRLANPAASAASLFRQGMIVGRDHIASTVYTLAFAYVGTALPLLLAAALVDRSLLDTLTAAQVAEEIARTLVASIGLILAIPLTTAIAARLARA